MAVKGRVTAKEVSLTIAAAPFGGCASANGRTVGSGRRLKCGRLTAGQLVCLERVVCSKSRVRARVKSGLLRSTSSYPMSLAKPFGARASRSHASETQLLPWIAQQQQPLPLSNRSNPKLRLIPSPPTRHCVFHTSSKWAAAASRDRLVAT